MLYPLEPGGRARGGTAGADAGSVSESSLSSSDGGLAAGATAGGLIRATAAGDIRAAGRASPISGAGGFIETGRAGGTDATAGDAWAAGDISDTGGSFSGGFGSG